tara:strand:- start:1750 stop:2244 length:495 start_codon:yes stop_codon:yes gene_type:complete
MGALSDFVRNPAFESALLYAVDEKPDGSSGGASNNDSYRTRDLNTILVNDIEGASLASNRVLLPPGSYYIEASAPASYSDSHHLALFNYTGSTYECFGTSEYTDSGAGLDQTRSFLFCKVTIQAATEFEFRHYTQSSRTLTGLGVGRTQGSPEIYLQAKIWKVA